MDYAGAVAYLDQLGHELLTAKLGLDNIRKLCGALGSPEASFRSVLIAGTNGKGSTAAILYGMLLEAGFPVGLYTSPHLIHPRERIRTGEAWISEQVFADRLSRVAHVARTMVEGKRLEAHPTYFEILTATAFLHFAESGVRLAVLEVGLGGRLDATNISRPLLSLITSLSLDHQEHLGDTMEHIAREKAGILRRGIPALLGPVPESAAEVVSGRAAEVSARLSRLNELVQVADHGVEDGYHRFDILTAGRCYGGLRAPLRGAQQVTNTALAVAACELLAEAGYPIAAKQTRAGLARTWWPGRMQVMREAPRLLLDGAHNPEAMTLLAGFLSRRPKGTEVIVIFGAMRDKDWQTLGALLFPLAFRMILTKSRNARAADPEAMRQAFGQEYSDRLQVAGSVGAAIAAGLALAKPRDWVVLTGSLYLVGEALEHLGFDTTPAAAV